MCESNIVNQSRLDGRNAFIGCDRTEVKAESPLLIQKRVRLISYWLFANSNRMQNRCHCGWHSQSGGARYVRGGDLRGDCAKHKDRDASVAQVVRTEDVDT